MVSDVVLQTDLPSRKTDGEADFKKKKKDKTLFYAA